MPEQYHVPRTAAEMLPPRTTDLVTEISNCLRAHWDEVRPLFQSISGEIESVNGSLSLDKAACVFKFQAIGAANGFALLGSAKPIKLQRALRYAFKRNTGVTMKLLESQYKQRRLAERAQRN